MRVQYSKAWGAWQAQEVIKGELVTIFSTVSRESAINKLIKIIYDEKL